MPTNEWFPPDNPSVESKDEARPQAPTDPAGTKDVVRPPSNAKGERPSPTVSELEAQLREEAYQSERNQRLRQAIFGDELDDPRKDYGNYISLAEENRFMQKEMMSEDREVKFEVAKRLNRKFFEARAESYGLTFEQYTLAECDRIDAVLDARSRTLRETFTNLFLSEEELAQLDHDANKLLREYEARMDATLKP